MVYGVVGGDELTDEQRQHLEDLINEEIVKAGIAECARVRVLDAKALMSFVPTWGTELSDAVDAGIERYRA
jgi:hypothetical protein